MNDEWDEMRNGQFVLSKKNKNTEIGHKYQKSKLTHAHTKKNSVINSYWKRLKLTKIVSQLFSSIPHIVRNSW